MTEHEWLTSSDPVPMLQYLRNRSSNRKLRLFAVACCRLLLRKVHLHDWYVEGLAVAERFADGGATVEELERAHHPIPSSALCPAGESYRITNLAITACWNAMEIEGGVAMADCAAGNAAWAATQPGPLMPDDNGVSASRLTAEEAVQCDILRDIVGNPFRSVGWDHGWQTVGNIGLARAIYEGRGFDRMPILANALIEVGCDSDDILAHCRSNGPHVQGCWVVDLLLGKE